MGWNALNGAVKWLAAAAQTRTVRWRISQLERAVAALLDRRFLRATPEHSALAERLRQELRELGDAAEGVAGSGASTGFWREKCLALQRCADSRDPMSFMRWQPVADTMQIGTSPLVIAAYAQLRRSPDWRRLWRPALRHARYGRPPPFLLLPTTTPHTVQNAGHLNLFGQTTGRSFLTADAIVEFGGGYGSLYRLVKALGFSGEHLIFDLPPILRLQRYYLALHGIEAAFGGGPRQEARERGSAAVWLYSDLQKLKAHIARFRSVAVISTWALSEMPMPLRDEIEPVLDFDNCRVALFAYQTEFEGLDNRKYFSGLKTRRQREWQWYDRQISYHRDNCYLFGVSDG